MSLQGLRVLALALKEVGGEPASREEAEACLEFQQFLILSQDLKHDTKRYITRYRNAGFRQIMITGDSLFTAI